MPSGPPEFIPLSDPSLPIFQRAVSYEHIENFTMDLEVRRDLGNQARVKKP